MLLGARDRGPLCKPCSYLTHPSTFNSPKETSHYPTFWDVCVLRLPPGLCFASLSPNERFRVRDDAGRISKDFIALKMENDSKELFKYSFPLKRNSSFLSFKLQEGSAKFG